MLNLCGCTQGGKGLNITGSDANVSKDHWLVEKYYDSLSHLCEIKVAQIWRVNDRFRREMKDSYPWSQSSLQPSLRDYHLSF